MESPLIWILGLLVIGVPIAVVTVWGALILWERHQDSR